MLGVIYLLRTHNPAWSVNMKYKAYLASTLFIFTSITSAGDVLTRYGKLSTNEDNILIFNGKVVKPEIQGNNSLSFPVVFKIGNTDVVLVQNNGGSACPALFNLLSITQSGTKKTPEFGTCSDLISHKQTASRITITMPKMRGRGKAIFDYENGVLTENGKPAK